MVARGILGLTVVLALAAAALIAAGPGHATDDLFGGVGGLSFIALGTAFGAVGTIVAVRVPGNRIGLLFACIGLYAVLGVLLWAYADHGLGAGRPPLTALAAAFPSEGLAGLLGVALLLFPDGRLPGRAWRPVGGVLGAGIVLLLASGSLRPGRLDAPFDALTNPLGVPGLRGAMDAADALGWLLVVSGLVLAAASLVSRLRRAHGAARQQLKLVLAVGTVVALVTAGDMVTWFAWPDGPLQERIAVIGLAFALFPLAAGVAILRHGLYDVDVAINRAVVYGALTATLLLAYGVTVLLTQLVLPARSDLGVAASTLAAAALFRPARARIQRLVDRRFYRRRYDAQRTLERFGARLRDEVDLDALAAELTGAVGETVQPAHVSLWMREPA